MRLGDHVYKGQAAGRDRSGAVAKRAAVGAGEPGEPGGPARRSRPACGGELTLQRQKQMRRAKDLQQTEAAKGTACCVQCCLFTGRSPRPRAGGLGQGQSGVTRRSPRHRGEVVASIQQEGQTVVASQAGARDPEAGDLDHMTVEGPDLGGDRTWIRPGQPAYLHDPGRSEGAITACCGRSSPRRRSSPAAKRRRPVRSSTTPFFRTANRTINCASA